MDLKQLAFRAVLAAGLVILLAASMAAAAPADVAEKLGIEASGPAVGKYERIEFRLAVPRQYDNPFDPDEVRLDLVLTGPGGRQTTVPAFFCQDYQRRVLGGQRRPRSWMYPAGMPGWKARFAPMETGRYEAVAVLTDRRGTIRSGKVAFECTPSRSKGFLRPSRKDPRYFEFTEGQPFFAIGQNLAFIGEGQYVTLAKAEEIFGKLHANGANYLRVWTCCQDWAMAIEARKSAWRRSWGEKAPIVPLPGQPDQTSAAKCLKLAGAAGTSVGVTPSHDVALRPETRYVLAGRVMTEDGAALQIDCGGRRLERPAASPRAGEWAAFKIEFETGPGELWLPRTALRLDSGGTAYLGELSLKEAGGGPELLWEADVNRPARGYYNPLDCFMLDQVVSAAERSGLYLQLCVITRDLYMGDLKDDKSPEYQKAIDDAKKLMRYCVGRWGYSTAVADWEYWNEQDPNLPTDRFYREVGDYLARIDPYHHLRATSTWHPSPRDMHHPQLDMAGLHFYLRPSEYERYRDEVDAAVDRARFLRENAPQKPALIDEFGLANEKWQPTDEMRQSDKIVDFHNGIWASALSGTSGTALFWWWDRLDSRNHYVEYAPLAAFLEGVPWTTAGLKTSEARVSDQRVRLVGQQGRDRAYLWLFNPEASWANVVIKKVTPQEIRGSEVEVSGLAPGTYRAQWWDTRAGKPIETARVSVSGQPLRLKSPPFDRDVACKIEPAG